MQRPPILKTERLNLRPFKLDDAPVVAILAGEREIAFNTLHIPHPYEVGMAENWIGTHRELYQKGEQLVFAIERKSDRKLLGAVGLALNQKNSRAELGYWVGKPYWGQGYCTEAVEEVLRYGFEELELNRIHASHFSRNVASAKVMEKIGMKYEGCLRNHVYKWGEYLDLVYRAVLKSEYEAAHK
ncbi:MAG: GNAT family N-acetyltransferase [candidate division Zixibacteria bacterium]|nr:GNAT family N-acetyltransferase [candidate division Zixibacteria bacterium]